MRDVREQGELGIEGRQGSEGIEGRQGAGGIEGTEGTNSKTRIMARTVRLYHALRVAVRALDRGLGKAWVEIGGETLGAYFASLGGRVINLS